MSIADMIVTEGSHRRAGFTLIELLISSVLMAGILAAGYFCLQGGVMSRDMIEARAEVTQRARVAMDMMTADLRAATALTSESAFVGVSRMLDKVEADSIDFATHNYIPRRAGESDFCETSYFVDKGVEGGFSLWRRQDPTWDSKPYSGGARQEIVSGIAGLRFEYYDGWSWYDDWGSSGRSSMSRTTSLLTSGLYGMPEAVRITLLFAPTKEANTTAGQSRVGGHGALTFQTVVRLNLVNKPIGVASHGMTNNPSADPTGATEEGGGQ